MSQKVFVQLVDDLDGTVTDDITTVQFGLDGATYEIDLTEDNAEQLRNVMADYVDSARRTGGRVKRGIRPSANGAGTRDDASKIREWAQANGIELATRGRIPSHVAESYRQAQAGEKTGPAKSKSKPKRRPPRRN